MSIALFVSVILSLGACLADDNVETYDQLAQASSNAAANHDYSTAFDDALLAVKLDPTRQDTKNLLLNTLIQNTPQTIVLPELMSANSTSLPFDVISTRTEADTAASDDLTVLLVPRTELASDENDPVQNWPFSRVLYVYSSHDSDKIALLCTIHYQTADSTDLAEHTGALLALLDRTYSSKLKIERADGSGPFDVWLCATAPISNGGEQWRSNLYFYDVSDERSSIEWIREIAHEFSHLAFPAVGGSYTNPEAFANGYIGERLLTRWLSRGAEGGADSIEAAWKGTFSGYYNFNRLLIAPPELDFQKYGLNRTKLAERDAEGMTYLVGLFLTVDDRCGSAAVGQILQQLADQHSSDPNLLYAPVKALLKNSISKSAAAP